MRNIYTLFVTCLLLINLPLHGQIDNPPKKKRILPKSIYALNYFHQTSDSGFSPFTNTEIPSYDFVFVDFDDLENNSFSIDLNNFLKKPSSMIYDDYANYNNYPLKGFLRQHDPTRWICPIMPPTW
jgi:hypothetical protein